MRLQPGQGPAPSLVRGQRLAPSVDVTLSPQESRDAATYRGSPADGRRMHSFGQSHWRVDSATSAADHSPAAVEHNKAAGAEHTPVAYHSASSAGGNQAAGTSAGASSAPFPANRRAGRLLAPLRSGLRSVRRRGQNSTLSETSGSCGSSLASLLDGRHHAPRDADQSVMLSSSLEGSPSRETSWLP